MSNAKNLAKAAIVPGGLAPTGSYFPYALATLPSGWLWMDGRTIGSSASGATARANADCLDLFTGIWTSYANTEAAVSGGRGASAAADWAANKTIAIPDMRGRVPAGKDNMGGVAASRLTTAGSGVNGATLGASGGAQDHALTETQMPAHTHDLAMKYNTVGGAGSSRNYWTRSGPDTLFDGTVTNGASAKGGGLAHNNTQPTLVANYIIKT